MVSHRHFTGILLQFWLLSHSQVYGELVACTKSGHYVVMCRGGCNSYNVGENETEVLVRSDQPDGCELMIQAEPGFGLQVTAGIHIDFGTCGGQCGKGDYTRFTDQDSTACECGSGSYDKGYELFITDKSRVSINYKQTEFAVLVRPTGCATSQLFSGTKATFNYKDDTPKTSSYIVNVTCPEGYMIGKRYSFVENRCNIEKTPRAPLVGTWEKPSVRCRKVKCSAPPQPPNGFYTPVAPDGDFKYYDRITYECLPGFRITSGQRIRSCLGVHFQGPVFSGSQPVCSRKDCGRHPAIPHSTNDSTSTLFNSSFTITCNRGYLIDGPKVVTCLESGTWSTAPACNIVECPYTPDVPHSTYRLQAVDDVDGNPRLYGNHFEFQCSMGFRMSGSPMVTCLENATYSPLPVCIAYQCMLDELPVSPAHTCRDCHDSMDVQVNSTRTYSCVSGYVHQEMVVTCLGSGRWSSLTACQRVDCGEPAPTANGIWTIDTTKYGGKANLTCDNGYKIDEIDRELTCSEDGAWVNGPTCVIVDCGAPPTGPNLVLKGRSYTTYNSQAIYECTEGHFFSNSSESATCLSSGRWTAVPRCQKIDCGMPANTLIANGSHEDIENTVYNTEINYNCEQGFMFVGAKSIICLKTGTWSERPQCVEINCGTPEAVPSATLVSNNSTGWNAKATYVCNFKDERTPETLLAVCQEDGKWAYPSCPQPVTDLLLYVYIGCGVGVVLIILMTVLSVGLCFKRKEEQRRKNMSAASSRTKGKAEGSQCSNDSGLFVEGDPGESEHAPSLSNYDYRNTADRLDVAGMAPYSSHSLTKPRSRQPLPAHGVCLEMMSVGGSEEELKNPLYAERKVDRKCSKNNSPCTIRNSPNISTGMSSPLLNNLGSKGYEDNHSLMRHHTLTPNSCLGNGTDGSMERYRAYCQPPRLIPGQELKKTLGSNDSLRIQDNASLDTFPEQRQYPDTPSVAF